jgi:hypothetical protein
MSILAQCGFGRGTKVEQGLAAGIVGGAIVSPRDEAPERILQGIATWRGAYPASTLLFDPQFYAATLNDPRDGHLREYSYYASSHGLGRAQFSGTQVQRYVRECLDYQHQELGNGLTYLVSPTVLFDGFTDSWSQIALNMAGESVQYCNTLTQAQPLLVSIVVSETAFQNMQSVEEYLDALTELDTAGFYLILRRNTQSLQNCVEAATFARFLYFCYVLAEINDYRIVVGYSDLHSFLLSAAGIDQAAAGWFQNLRQFSLARFMSVAGGRHPRHRYSSLPLLSCPLINPELQDVALVGMLSHVLSGSPHDRILQPDPVVGEANWSDETSTLAHWFSLTRMSDMITRQPTPQGRADEAARMMRDAAMLYSQLGRLGVSFAPLTGPAHIGEWESALRQFRSLTGI